MVQPIFEIGDTHVGIELEPLIRNGEHLLTGKPFEQFGGMRSREMRANCLLCVAINAVSEARSPFAATRQVATASSAICRPMADRACDGAPFSRQPDGGRRDPNPRCDPTKARHKAARRVMRIVACHFAPPLSRVFIVVLGCNAYMMLALSQAGEPQQSAS